MAGCWPAGPATRATTPPRSAPRSSRASGVGWVSCSRPLRQVRVRYQWCCFRPATADGQPVIDRVPGLDNAWVSAGHDGDGLLMAPATGQALASWIITSRQPQEVASFGLSRFDQLR